MKRKDFLTRCGACGALSLMGFLGLDKVQALEDDTKKTKKVNEEMNKEQIKALFKFIDSSVNESNKKKIFNKLGTECLYSRKVDNWVNSFKDNQDEFFDRVQRGESKYWEKLVYDKEKAVITLIGRKVPTCVCEYGQVDQAPKSLCNYCCKKFQEEMFGLLLNRKVSVRIDESVILGGERCSTTIFVK